MARRTVGHLLALIVLSGVTGCGTCLNMGEPFGIVVLDGTPTQRVYGGIRRDVSMALLPFDPLMSLSRAERIGACVEGCLFLADLPLSAVGDTLTLPWTITKALSKANPELPTGIMQDVRNLSSTGTTEPRTGPEQQQ